MRETRKKEQEVAKARKKQAKLDRRAAKNAEIAKTEPTEKTENERRQPSNVSTKSPSGHVR